jgi:hypothetical protein
MRQYWAYLQYLARHKWFVFLEACQLGIPIRGLLHDWKKLLPGSFIPYANHFYNNGSKKSGNINPGKSGDAAFDRAVALHVCHEKHHWQYWTITELCNGTAQIHALVIPRPFILEMVADWHGAGRAKNQPDTVAWYKANQDKMVLHPKARHQIEYLIGYKRQILGPSLPFQ